jgi:hypothetical protein
LILLKQGFKMKKTLALATLSAAAALTFSGCAMTVGAPATGFILTNAKGPGMAATPHKIAKTGTTQCQSILGLVASGDCSISTAAKNGGITKVATVDFDVSNILGLFATTTVIVTGE